MIINMKKLVIIVLIIAIGVGLISAFILLNSKPDKMTDEQREKAISEMLGRKANTNPNIKTGDTTYNGKYAKFEYPAAAKIYEHRGDDIKNNDSQIESFSIDLQSPRRVFYYTATKLDSGTSKLDDIPAVSFRKNASNGYSSNEEKVDGVLGTSFVKDRSGEFMAEKTGYFLVNGNLISISVTASSIRDAEDLYKNVTSSLIFPR